jgi:hypothetical protein
VSVAGTAVAVGALAKSALTLGFASNNFESYLHGTDVLGAELPLVERIDENTVRINKITYYTQVAAGLTVVAVWSLLTFITGRRQS